MSEAPGPSVPPRPAAAPPVTTPHEKPERLFQIAAWVAIVAGVVFIIATILFSICAFLCCR